jgi:hypothetical protein
MIFISHALPEDNEFTRWLALRLAKEGYPVWCDLTKLLGGEDFWRDIEHAIRNRTSKFLFVLSRTSNGKQGVRDELAVARQVGKDRQDFVIPLKIDDLPSNERIIELSRLNVVDFSENWITGLGRLLEKLEKDQVPKDERFNPSSVAEWWRDHMKAQGGIHQAGEPCVSNWFKIDDWPEHLFLHSLEGGKVNADKELPIGLPNFRFKGAIFAFEGSTAITERMKIHGYTVTETAALDLSEFQRFGNRNLRIERGEARNIVTNLLRRAFEMHCVAAGLREYAMAGEAKCYWFPAEFSEGDKIQYTHLNGRKTYRRMVGYKTLQPRDGKNRFRTWHFGIQGKIVHKPELVLAIKSHVVFSEEGQLYESKAKQHSARRGQCKMWHNDTWLDRMLAAMAFLSDPASHLFISVPLGTDVGYRLQASPLMFESPVSYETEDGTVSAVVHEDEDSVAASNPEEADDDDESEEDMA